MSVIHPAPITRDAKLRMAFQPIIDATSGEVYAYEALVRGPNGEGAGTILSQVAPNQRAGFDRRCRIAAVRAAVAAGINKTRARLAINIMPDAIDSPLQDAQQTIEMAQHFGMSPRRLMFEFSEHEQLAPNKLTDILKACLRCGFMTTFGNFGAESKGADLLRKFAPDFIKLESGLVGGIAGSWSRRVIAENLVTLASELRIRVIAEGVETAADMERMRGLGIAYFQGYFLCEPEIGAFPTFDETKLTASK